MTEIKKLLKCSFFYAYHLSNAVIVIAALNALIVYLACCEVK